LPPDRSLPEKPWVQPTGGALGADVHGLDLTEAVTPAAFAAVTQAWSDHLVLRFSGQRLSDPDLVRFSRRFGDLDERPEQGLAPGEPEDARWIACISNIVEAGRPLGALGYGEAAWHADMTYNPIPPRASLLYALECPAEGGATWFSNMYAAYEGLDDALKRRLAGLTCVHDASHDSTGRLRSGFVEAHDPRATPGARHPLVRSHPVTGRPCLFLGRRAGAYVVGLELAESEALLDALWAHATQDAFVWKQRWRVGDLLLWDNRCVLHRRDSFDAAARRLMHRTQVRGEAVQVFTQPETGTAQPGRA
jgi:taurine dioxygenase